MDMLFDLALGTFFRPLLDQRWGDCLMWIKARLREQRILWCHCLRGKNRSAAVTMAILASELDLYVDTGTCRSTYTRMDMDPIQRCSRGIMFFACPAPRLWHKMMSEMMELNVSVTHCMPEGKCVCLARSRTWQRRHLKGRESDNRATAPTPKFDLKLSFESESGWMEYVEQVCWFNDLKSSKGHGHIHLYSWAGQQLCRRQTRVSELRVKSNVVDWCLENVQLMWPWHSYSFEEPLEVRGSVSCLHWMLFFIRRCWNILYISCR